MLRDGSLAWELKDFLVAQKRCADVTVEGQVFPGNFSKKDKTKDTQHNEVGIKKKGRKKESKTPDVNGNHVSSPKLEL